MISTSLNSLGGFLRWYGGNNYEITMIAQTLGGIAQCFILQAPGGEITLWEKNINAFYPSRHGRMVCDERAHVGLTTCNLCWVSRLGVWKCFSLSLYRILPAHCKQIPCINASFFVFRKRFVISSETNSLSPSFQRLSSQWSSEINQSISLTLELYTTLTFCSIDVKLVHQNEICT